MRNTPLTRGRHVLEEGFGVYFYTVTFTRPKKSIGSRSGSYIKLRRLDSLTEGMFIPSLDEVVKGVEGRFSLHFLVKRYRALVARPSPTIQQSTIRAGSWGVYTMTRIQGQALIGAGNIDINITKY